MRLTSYEQTAHYHTKAADIAFTDGKTEEAISHLKAAYYSASYNREKYNSVIAADGIKRYDHLWQIQRELEAQ